MKKATVLLALILSSVMSFVMGAVMISRGVSAREQKVSEEPKPLFDHGVLCGEH